MSFVSKASVLECLDGHWFSWRLETVLEWMLSLDERLSGFLRSTVSLAPGIASLASHPFSKDSRCSLKDSGSVAAKTTLKLASAS